jgi:hypothetical protein
MTTMLTLRPLPAEDASHVLPLPDLDMVRRALEAEAHTDGAAR